MTVTEPYDIVDIYKKLHKKQLKGESQNTDCIRDLCNVYKGTGTDFAFLAMFQNTTQGDISVVVLRLYVS